LRMSVGDAARKIFSAGGMLSMAAAPADRAPQ
jgi:hypothetical protein